MKKKINTGLKFINWSMLFFFLLFTDARKAVMAEPMNQKRNNFTVNEQTKVLDIINHSLLNGFGQFLFPVERGLPTASMTLGNINTLLPYHSRINSKATVEIVNYMLDVTGNGKTIFYNIYSNEEKQKDPRKVNTGLFFLKGILAPRLPL